MAALPVVVATLHSYPQLTVLVESEAIADAAARGPPRPLAAAAAPQQSRGEETGAVEAPALVNGSAFEGYHGLLRLKRPGVVARVPSSPSIFSPSNATPSRASNRWPTTPTPRLPGIQDEIDLVVCLGGDGLILHVVSHLFPRVVPPVMPFNNGSLGFLTPFNVCEHKAEIARVITGQNNIVTMRMRLKCVIVPKGSEFLDDAKFRTDGPQLNVANGVAADGNCSAHAARSHSETGDFEAVPSRTPSADPKLLEYHVLNEIVIDRGPAPYLSNLEVLADDCPVTRVQADGLIVATPTGSTAYSLSSGGSMVHPSVPAILFTPICPHSLSFRPVLFPHDVVLQIKVPEDARASAWVSCDGRHRMELQRGDKVVVCASQYPVPTFTRRDTTRDWFASVSQCLRWNERVQQTPLFTDDERVLLDGGALTSPTAEVDSDLGEILTERWIVDQILNYHRDLRCSTWQDNL
jgi:NAD kinase